MWVGICRKDHVDSGLPKANRRLKLGVKSEMRQRNFSTKISIGEDGMAKMI